MTLSVAARRRPFTTRGAAPMVLPLLLTFACGGSMRSPEPSSDRSISQASLAELSRRGVSNAYEAVRRMQPLLMRTRGPGSIRVPTEASAAVYVDRMLIGDLGVLQDIPLRDVREIRYLSAWDATTKYGARHAHGVIEVETRY